MIKALKASQGVKLVNPCPGASLHSDATDEFRHIDSFA